MRPAPIVLLLPLARLDGMRLLQQQQSVTARTQHRRRAARIVHHLLNAYSL